ncbi:MAG TPA: TlpA disulfide reductase family protein, partial [Gammaproteobacteria bacterium]|nr:TlpA disulfide reductase family protein [Gammaproteobacteria bacterium]
RSAISNELAVVARCVVKRADHMKSIRLLSVLFALLLVSSDAAARASGFEVRTLDGAVVPLSTYFEPGKWTMVMLWTTYCGTCRSQYPVISEFHDKHKDTDAKVIGVSLDGFVEVDRVRAYIASKPMAFNSTIAEVAALRPAYKAITEEPFTGTPTYLMFDPNGALVAHVQGPLAIEDVENFIAENGE